jgi:hypothetical protein
MPRFVHVAPLTLILPLLGIVLPLGQDDGRLVGSRQDYAPQEPCRVAEAYRATGWSIPGIGDDPPRLELVRGPETDGITWHEVKKHKTRATATEFGRTEGHPERISIDENPRDVLAVQRLSAKGVVFAYLVNLGDAVIEHGKWVSIGSASVVLYYDANGSGRFSVMRYHDLFAKIPVPGWVKTMQQRCVTPIFFVGPSISVRVDTRDIDGRVEEAAVFERDRLWLALGPEASAAVQIDAQGRSIEFTSTLFGGEMRFNAVGNRATFSLKGYSETLVRARPGSE